MAGKLDDQWFNPSDVGVILIPDASRLSFFVCEDEKLGAPRGSLCSINWKEKVIYFTSSYGNKVIFHHGIDMRTWERVRVNVLYSDKDVINSSFQHIMAIRVPVYEIDFMNPLINPEYKQSQIRNIYEAITSAMIKAKEMTTDVAWSSPA